MGNELSLSAAGLADLLQSALSKEASLRFQVKGFSMSPFINDSDIVTVSPWNKRRIIFGRAVAFIHPYHKNLVIHRIVGRSNGHYIIKGDNTPERGSLVPEENILGYVSRIERHGKDITLGLGSERLAMAFLSKTGVIGYILRFRRFIPAAIRRALL